MTAATITILSTDDYCTVYNVGPAGWAGRKVTRIEVKRVDRVTRFDHELSFRIYRGAKPLRAVVYGGDLVVVRGHWPEMPIPATVDRKNFDLWLAGKSVLLDARRV